MQASPADRPARPVQPPPARAKGESVCRLTRMLIRGERVTFLDRASGELWMWVSERCIFEPANQSDGA